MAENTPANGAGAPSAATAQLSVQKIYVKDASFEAPAAPAIFQEQGQPQIQISLAQKVAGLGENVYEIVLTVTVTCKIGEKTAYLAEVQQAGVFGLSGFDGSNLDAVIGTYCPNVIFPYARQMVSDLIQAGGFPPFLLQPINFEQLYTEQLRRRADAQATATV